MPEGAGWDATEGSGPSVAGADTFYPEGEKLRQGYMEKDGVLHVPRRTAGGGTPMVDLKKGLSQFQVNIIDGNNQQSYEPGETDPQGNPLPKADQCQNNSPDPATPSPGSPPQSPTPPPQSSSPTAGTSTESVKPPTKRRGRQSQPPTETENLLRSLTEQVLSLQRQQSSHTSAPSPTSAPVPPGSELEAIQIHSELGEFSFEVLGVEDRNEGVLGILWDPKKPRMIPKGDNPIVVHWRDKLYRCDGGAMSMQLCLGGQEILLAVLPLLETQG